MSGVEAIWNVGQAIVAEDLQRLSDVAAFSCDQPLGVLATPAASGATIVPLDVESPTLNPRLLVYPSTTDGKVAIRRCAYLGATDLGVMGLACTQARSTDDTGNSPSVPANAGGSTAYALVYAALQLASTTGTRKQKSTTDGSVSTQTLVLYYTPNVTFAVNAGFVSAAAARASLPAAGTNQFYYAMAVLAVPPGYAGGAFAQNHIQQAWNVGGVPQDRTVARILSLMGTGAPGDAGTALSGRWPSPQVFEGVINHDSNGRDIPLDGSIDWRKRRVAVRLVRATSDGGALPAPESVTLAGVSFALEDAGYTGTDESPAVSLTGHAIGLAGTDVTFTIYASAAGLLRLHCAGSPSDNVLGDKYTVAVTTTARYEF